MAPGGIPEVVLEKIQKVQRLAERAGSEGEAQAAILALQRLLSKHGLTDADVATDWTPDEKVVEESAVEVFAKKVSWKGTLSMIICDNFRCVPFYSYIPRGTRVDAYGYHVPTHSSRLMFVGLSDDVQIAQEAYQITTRAIERLFKQWLEVRRREMSRQGYQMTAIDSKECKRSYIDGFLTGLRGALKKQVQTTGMELVLVKDPMVGEYMTRTHGKMRSKGYTQASRGYDSGARQAGREAGSNFDFTPKRKLSTGTKGVIGS